MIDKVYLLFKGNTAMQMFIGAYSKPEYVLAMANEVIESRSAVSVKIDVHTLDVPIPLILPPKPKKGRR